MLSPHVCCLLVCVISFGTSESKAYPSVNLLFQNQASSTPSLTGIELFGKGDDQGAIKALRATVGRNKNDVQAWHYLGLALERQGKTDDARKAHEKAAKLGDVILDALFLKMDGRDDARYFREIPEQLSVAASSAQKYIALSRKLSKSKQAEWTNRAESLRDFAELSEAKNDNSDQPHIFTAKEVTTKVRVLSKPEPMYTEKARENQITGAIVLIAIFSADGKVRAIRPIKTLPDGLTRNAINAARQIKFIPALKDGKPVSMFLHLEYNFNLY
jgi:tetratricopeptide (TPR) repeat protein